MINNMTERQEEMFSFHNWLDVSAPHNFVAYNGIVLDMLIF